MSFAVPEGEGSFTVAVWVRVCAAQRGHGFGIRSRTGYVIHNAVI